MYYLVIVMGCKKIRLRRNLHGATTRCRKQRERRRRESLERQTSKLACEGDVSQERWDTCKHNTDVKIYIFAHNELFDYYKFREDLDGTDDKLSVSFVAEPDHNYCQIIGKKQSLVSCSTLTEEEEVENRIVAERATNDILRLMECYEVKNKDEEIPMMMECSKENEVEERTDIRCASLFPVGHFICDLGYVIEEIQAMEEHRQICPFGGKFIFKEMRKQGLGSILTFVCSNVLCSRRKTFSTERTPGNLNKLSVLGAITTGSGFSQEEEKYNCMNVSYMSWLTFNKNEKLIGSCLQNSTEETTIAAIHEEIRLAEIRNDIDNDGNYCISATIDGGWCKRSYGHGYNASSGVAIIIGNATKKIIFIGIRNKLCMTCNAIDAGRLPNKEHFCWKNWTGPSTGMESDIILEGLKYLDETFHVRCNRLVGDGDANTMLKVRQHISYGHDVMKIECANHACRRIRRALEKIQKSTHEFNGQDGIHARKELKKKIPQLVNGARTTIKKNAVQFNSIPDEDSIKKMQEEFLNGPDHVFGNHEKCGSFCTKAAQEINTDMHRNIVSCGMMTAIKSEINRVLVNDAKTLIFNYTNNPAEHFMSLLCKTLGGKRVDHSKAGGVGRRANAAALAFQRPDKGAHFDTIKKITGNCPGPHYKRLVERRERKREYSTRRNQVMSSSAGKFRKRKHDYVQAGGDSNYGENAARDDMQARSSQTLEQGHLDSLCGEVNSPMGEITRANPKSLWEKCLWESLGVEVPAPAEEVTCANSESLWENSWFKPFLEDL